MQDVMLSRAIDMFKILAENEYSALWDLVEDFTVNGHTVSVKRSNQFKQVIIDNRYVAIGGKMVIHSGDKVFQEPLDYVAYILSK